MPYEILLQHVSIVSCLCIFGISHFGLYYLYSSTNIVNGTEVLINDLGVYKAQVEVNGIPKSGNGGYSTFFSKEMSPQDVIDSINEAYNNKVFVVGSKNSYIGISNNGLEIEMYINNNGKIISAFPKE